MAILTPEATIFFAFMVAILGPPALAGVLYHAGMKSRVFLAPATVLSGLLIIVWVPLVVLAPSIIQTYFGS